MNSPGLRSLVSPFPFQVSQQEARHATGHVEVHTGFAYGLTCTNLVTPAGRRRVAQLILGIALIPMLAMLIQNAYDLSQSREKLSNMQSIKQHVMLNMKIGTIVHFIQLERGTSALYLSSRADPEVFSQVEQFRHKLDLAIQDMGTWRWTLPQVRRVFSMAKGVTWMDFSSRDSFAAGIKHFREVVNLGIVNVTEVLSYYSELNVHLTNWMVSGMLSSYSDTLWSMLVAFHMLIVAKEQAGVERAYGSTFYAQGEFSGKQMARYLQKKFLGESYLERFQQYKEGGTKIESDYVGSTLQGTIERMRETITANVKIDPDVEMGQRWFDNMTDYIDILKATQDAIAGAIVAGLDTEIRQQEDSLVISICIMSGAIILLFLVIISVHRLTKRLQSFAVTLQEKTVALNIERKRSENLLNELMPANVARKLLANEPVEPESFPAVTIFFSDIVGFTSISSRSSPLQVIDMLNILYKTFDETLDLYNVYKVETIGDAYMIASGLPVRNEEGHAVEMGELALELRDTICNMAVPHLPDDLIQIRIGLNSGSVVSGVVGYKMPRYCLFGDTVNVASRMESSGLPAKIQIAGSTYLELKRHESFFMEQRGEVEIKGKGKMVTYFLVGKASFRPRRENTYSTMVN